MICDFLSQFFIHSIESKLGIFIYKMLKIIGKALFPHSNIEKFVQQVFYLISFRL